MIALIGSANAVTQAVAARLRARGERHVLCEMRAAPEPVPRAKSTGQLLTFRIEHLGSLLARLRDMGVGDVCLIGGVGRPAIDPSQVDAATAPLVPRLLAALGTGDDAALRIVLSILEEAGFRVRAAQDLAPDLLPAPGVLSSLAPGAQHRVDAARAEAAHRLIAGADIGQAVIVRGGRVQAVEAAPGTRAMIEGTGRDHTEGALLYKAPKAGQDRRVDLPVIGPATVEQALRAGLSAVVVEAGGVMVLRPDECARLADEGGLVLWVREPGG